jgi:hypothetical protein
MIASLRREALFVLLGLLTGMRLPAQAAATTATGSLAGVVRDPVGTPLADVSVTLQGEAIAARSDSAGRFALADVPVGSHTALFRRIGYRSVEYRWTAQAERVLQIAVTMTPVPRQLERIVVEAPLSSRRRGTSSIAGTILDSAGHPLSGADVRLLGSGLSTETDASGGFEFRSLAAGSYIVRARRLGRSSGNYVIQIADDDNGGITLRLYGLPAGRRDTTAESGYGAADLGFEAFDRRTRNGVTYPLLGPADLFRQNRAPLDLVLQRYRDDPNGRSVGPAMRADDSGSREDGDCLLVDNRSALYQPLRAFTSLETMMVEVFRRNAPVDAFIVTQMEGHRECRGGMDRHPPYYVLWTRRLR